MPINAEILRKGLHIFIPALLLFTACKRQTPPEMLFGNWHVVKIEENGQNVTELYVEKTTAYLSFTEAGNYRIGLMDTVSEKSWLVYPENNELVLLEGGIIEDIKKWMVVASDNQIKLKYPARGIIITLKRVSDLPELTFKKAEDLVGKWVVEKVTINGSNSTNNYAFPDRWIILAENGRFYNGANNDDQNTGFWKTNESLTRIEFRVDKKEDSPALSFYVANELIWYQKQQSEDEKHAVRIYFKKAG